MNLPIPNRCPNGGVMVDGECVSEIAPDYVVDSLLTGYAGCVYGKLKGLGLFKETIGNFIENPDFHLNLKLGNCINTNEACTDGTKIEEGYVDIIVEGFGNSALELAATILHEGIHAEMYRYVESVQAGNDPNDKPRIFQFFNLYNGFVDENGDPTGAQHHYMSENYVEPIALAIQKLDNAKYPLEYYMGYGWDGLEAYGYSDNVLTPQERDELYRLQKIVNDNSIFGNECK